MTWKTYVYPNIIVGLLYFAFDVIFLSSDVAVLSPFFQNNCKNASNWKRGLELSCLCTLVFQRKYFLLYFSDCFTL